MASTKWDVGETSIALNVAAVLARGGHKVVVRNADPAGHALAVSEFGALPFPVMALLLEEVEAKAVSAWTKAVWSQDADFVTINALKRTGGCVRSRGAGS